MQKRTKLGLVLIAVFVITAVWQHEGVAHAQTANVANLTDAQTGEVILVGAIAGLLVAYQQESKSTTPVNWLQFPSIVLQTTVVTIPIAITSALTSTNLNLLGLVLVFFAAIGVQAQAAMAKKPVIPLNARKA